MTRRGGLSRRPPLDVKGPSEHDDRPAGRAPVSEVELRAPCLPARTRTTLPSSSRSHRRSCSRSSCTSSSRTPRLGDDPPDLLLRRALRRPPPRRSPRACGSTSGSSSSRSSASLSSRPSSPRRARSAGRSSSPIRSRRLHGRLPRHALLPRRPLPHRLRHPRLNPTTRIPVALLGTVALVLTYTSYVAEVLRAGLESVHPSQRYAARSLGLTHGQTLRRIIVPQAIRKVTRR